MRGGAAQEGERKKGGAGQHGFEARAPFVMAIGTEWLPFDSLVNDPRYIELLRKIGVAVGLDGPLPKYRAEAD